MCTYNLSSAPEGPNLHLYLNSFFKSIAFGGDGSEFPPVRGKTGSPLLCSAQGSQMLGKTARKVSLAHPCSCATNARKNQDSRAMLVKGGLESNVPIC